MTKKELFDYFTSSPNPDRYGVEKSEFRFMSNHPDMYSEFVSFEFNEDLKDKPFVQRLWHFLQDDKGCLGFCGYCRRRCRFISFMKGYQKYCCNDCSNKSPETKMKSRKTKSERTPEQKAQLLEKLRNTCDRLYGGIGFSSKYIMGKYGDTMERDYGYRHNFLVPEIIEKRNNTWKTRYGTDNPMKNEEVAKKSGNTQKGFSEKRKLEKIAKSKRTRKERYGSENYTNRMKSESTCEKLYGSKNAMESEECRMRLSETLFGKMKEKYPFVIGYDPDDKRFLLCRCVNDSCKKCSERIFRITGKTFKYRIKNGNELCTKLNRPYSGKRLSNIENDVYVYIRDIYDGKILRNVRKILDGKELDIYLPEINLAFEINGDFWHLNPEIYSNDYEYKGRTVKSEQMRRDEKNKLAETKGIELIHIWQYDWKKKQNEVKETIKKYIAGKLKNIMSCPICE